MNSNQSEKDVKYDDEDVPLDLDDVENYLERHDDDETVEDDDYSYRLYAISVSQYFVDFFVFQ